MGGGPDSPGAAGRDGAFTDHGILGRWMSLQSAAVLLTSAHRAKRPARKKALSVVRLIRNGASAQKCTYPGFRKSGRYAGLQWRASPVDNARRAF